MKNSISYTLPALVAGLLIGAASMAVAQDTATQSFTMSVDEIAVLDVTGTPGTLTITAPVLGGDAPVEPTDNSTYAQYTSTVADLQTRKITAQMDAAAPAGTSLLLTATAAGGTAGTGATDVVLNMTTAGEIVTGIASVATGTGATDGAQLSYKLKVDDATALVASATQAVVVTLTLTAAN